MRPIDADALVARLKSELEHITKEQTVYSMIAAGVTDAHIRLIQDAPTFEGKDASQ